MQAALARALNAVPDDVQRSRRFALGTYRGLRFGVERHPGGAGDVYLEGAAVRDAILSCESQGPRAVMNALGRIAEDFPEALQKARHDHTLAPRPGRLRLKSWSEHDFLKISLVPR